MPLACGLLTCMAPVAVVAGEAVQPGFYYHAPEASPLELKNMRSGPVCQQGSGPQTVCETAIRIVITGDQQCDWSPGVVYPCSRFGYEFDYAGATPGTSINCTIRKTDPQGRKQESFYEHSLDTAAGSIRHTTFRTYAPVEQRLIFSEAHECAYQGQLVATIEYIIYYEPGSGATDDRPHLDELPDTCAWPFLTEEVAGGLLDADVKRSVASEHLPILSSQCFYSSRGTSAREAGMVLKFMLSDMFNVQKVPSMQLNFNATFAAGGADLEKVLDDLGDKSFVFGKGDRTTLLVITGIAGRADLAGRPTELIAFYYLEWPELDKQARLARLIPLAEQHLAFLHSNQQP